MSATHLIAGYFMWHDQGARYWQDLMDRFPLLGSVDNGQHVGYDQADPAYIGKTLLWARAHGIRTLAPIWRGAGIADWDKGMRDKIETFRTVINRPQYDNLTWCVFLGNFYFEQAGKPPADFPFGNPGSPTQAYENFVGSLKKLGGGTDNLGWLEDKRYFKLNGKPVVLIFQSKKFQGAYQAAVNEVREYYDDRIYLIGMSAEWYKTYQDLSAAEIARIRPFDAVTAWSAMSDTPNAHPDLKSVAEFLAPKVATWKQEVPKLTVNGTASTRVVLVPSITAQYDKSKDLGTAAARAAERYARSKADFQTLVQVAADNLDPGGVRPSGDKLVWLQTFNEWPEGTTCEPTELDEGYPYQDPQYRNHYGFEFLEVLRNVLLPSLKHSPREAVPISPADGATGCTTTPTFSWDRVDANPPVTQYRLKITRGGSPVFDQALDVGELTDGRKYSLTQALEPGTEYQWQVQTISSWKAPTSDWSRARTFHTA